MPVPPPIKATSSNWLTEKYVNTKYGLNREENLTYLGREILAKGLSLKGCLLPTRYYW